MRYGLRDVPALLATPAGREQLHQALLYRSWPVLSRLARAWRRTGARRTRVVAVVGSYGKSTTTRVVATVLGLPLHPAIASNAWGSVALAVLRIRRGQPRAAIEVGIAAPGQMVQYARVVRPDVVVVTSIGSEHRRSLHTLDVTREEKSQMPRALPPAGVAVLNGDDPNVRWMAGVTRARVVAFGFGADCDVRASDYRLEWPRGSRFRVRVVDVEREVVVPLFGRHTVYAALAALAVASVEGIAVDDAIAALGTVSPACGRLEAIALPGEVTVLRDDFKSNLETMHAALDVLADVPARRIVLFGDLTEPPSSQGELYRALGARVASLAAHFVLVGPSAQRYASGARSAGMRSDAIHDCKRDPRQAAAVLRALLQPGDVVLIKGRHTQMLDRVRLILQGRRVGCNIPHCPLNRASCEGCAMLEPGWGGRRVVLRRAAKAAAAVNSDHGQPPSAPQPSDEAPPASGPAAR